ncbi:CHRD domain-containing protein [Bythopirellula polymerisocia]|uniref:CHRD domain protein n=1 Tax=Bythopirellula polymerisocia TaxID=2528003 RepID=A0A5C6CF49_9BACT|nr:CHRD domain-containing protein [Bythopirellula polymerisocia]TWU22742.1 CHRD domain protein [Bythopirellula polymerisocia]
MKLVSLSLVLVMTSLVSVVSAHEQKYAFDLSGAAEAPPNASPGTGSALVTFDLDLVTMRVQADFTGLIGTTTAAHIHCCTVDPGVSTAGVATVTPTFTGFPAGVSAGTYDHTFDMTQTASYNTSFVTANGGTASGALNAILAGLDAGKAYFNVHSSSFGGGEIRGFGVLVPEPTSALLTVFGLSVSLLGRRRWA